MLCKMPSLHLSAEFEDRLRTERISTVPIWRQNTEVSVIPGYNTTNKSVLVYLGFVLDGCTKYENVNKVLKNVSINFVAPPVGQKSCNSVVEFNSKTETFISIAVSFSIGCECFVHDRVPLPDIFLAKLQTFEWVWHSAEDEFSSSWSIVVRSIDPNVPVPPVPVSNVLVPPVPVPNVPVSNLPVPVSKTCASVNFVAVPNVPVSQLTVEPLNAHTIHLFITNSKSHHFYYITSAICRDD